MGSRLMAFLKSTPLTFTGIPRLPEDTVQLCTSSQVLLGRLLGISLGYVDPDGLSEGFGVGPAEGRLLGISLGPILGFVEGIRLTLGLPLGSEAGSTEIDGCKDGVLDGSIVRVGILLGLWLGYVDTVGNTLGIKEGPIDTDGVLLVGDPDQVARKKYYFQSRIVRTDRDKFTNQNGRNREIFDFFLLPRVYKQYSCPNNCFFTTALFVLQRVRPKNLEFSPIFFSRENGVIKY
jgi:hypothetical protein